MTFHPADPRDEVRECLDHRPIRTYGTIDGEPCPLCNGTGQIGNPDAERPIEVCSAREMEQPGGGWCWSFGRTSGWANTAPEALLAARCAWWGVEISYSMKGSESDGYMWNGHGSFPTPDAALCAAIDARKEADREHE